MAELAWAAPDPIPEQRVLPDEEVLRRVARGEVALYEVIMRRYNQRLYRIARGILGNDDEAIDVLQDAYVRAYAHLDRFRGEASVPTWLTRIVMHEAWTRSRHRRRYVALEHAHASLEHAALTDRAGIDPERNAHTRQLREALERSIDALSPSYRTVLMMRDVEGLSTRETAALLGISANLVKVRLHRAREATRRELLDRAGLRAADLFGFGFERCDGIVATVLDRLGRRAG